MTALTEPVIRCISADKIWGDTPPYSGGNEDAVERHLEVLVANLGLSDRIGLEADFESYGSGWASYVDVFVWLSDRSGHLETRERTDISGLHLYLCRSAPFAAWGPGTSSVNQDGGGSGDFLEWNEVGELPPGRWKEAIAEIEEKLREAGLEPLSKKEIEPFIPADIRIQTISNPPYRVFDAIFHWID